MLKQVTFIYFLGLTVNCYAQLEKSIIIKSFPSGALVTNMSGRKVLLGNTPLKENFNFHSEISILKIKLMKCGFNDTIIKINPSLDSLTINLLRRKFMIIPEGEKDKLINNEVFQLNNAVNDFLNDFSARNSKEPINFIDFASIKRIEKNISLHFIFEVEPEYIPNAGKSEIELSLFNIWNKWLSESLKRFKQLKDPVLSTIYFSIISSRQTFTIRHMPGIDIRDERKSRTSVYETDNYKITTIDYWYETITTPKFNSNTEQSQINNELLFKASYNPEKKEFCFESHAQLVSSNGELTTLFSSSQEIIQNSMFIKLLGERYK